jgi:dTMP kinase
MTGGSPAFFIAFEGGEAPGKSTQAARLASRIGAVLTREPGGTPVGERLRALLLEPETGHVDPRAEALLMAADRAQHVASVVRPALDAGRHVVTDRYLGSSLAYQGYGRRLDVAMIERISMWATGGLLPDVVLFLDIPTSVAAERLGRTRDRFEDEDDQFHERVAEGFRAIATSEPDRWVIIDGTLPIDAVSARVDEEVGHRLALE